VVRQASAVTAQDGGRRGFEQIGVPVAGALHRDRYLTATALISGRPDEGIPALEILGGVLALSLVSDVLVGVVGPGHAFVDGREAANGTLILGSAGARLDVRHAGRGPVYVVIGGWQPERTLGSCSVDTFSNLGGGPFTVGDVLRGSAARPDTSSVGRFHRALPETSGPLKVVGTGHPDAGAFCERTWQVGAVARSGVRLTARGWVPRVESIVSMPVLRGAIQITPGGEAIVLGPDGALTGGYPVVGVVATADLDRMSLLQPGDATSFAEISVAQAARAYETLRDRRMRSLAHPSAFS
jgi:allophanate hydrolase subunit 2